jgi:catechol 2,3-dioxygenase-like lactoylglutathione lyase family enzyme
MTRRVVTVVGDLDGRGGMDGIGWIGFVTIDCADPERLAAWWGDLLRLKVGRRGGPYVELERPQAGVPKPTLVFQRVAEPKVGKARIHLDIVVTDLAAATRRALALGASIAEDLASEDPWLVMRDPEGNEFCLIPTPTGADPLAPRDWSRGSPNIRRE